MSSSWKSLKNLFWQGGEPTAGSAEEITDEELAALLSDSPHAVPESSAEAAEAETEGVALASVAMRSSGEGLVIDFQAQYDAAGIPNSDEVEKLEDFLGRLDPQLPVASKVAAAEAFLGAIGKARADVLADAELKIKRVRGLVNSKAQDTDAAMRREQAAIDELQQQIEAHRLRLQQATQELDAFRHACVLEESRLQAARIFFGNAGHPSSGGGAGAAGDPAKRT